jgi:hypothetical protein
MISRKTMWWLHQQVDQHKYLPQQEYLHLGSMYKKTVALEESSSAKITAYIVTLPFVVAEPTVTVNVLVATLDTVYGLSVGVVLLPEVKFK